MSNVLRYDHDKVFQHMQEANSQLNDEVRKIKTSEYKKLFQQTRSFIDALERCPLSRHRSYGPSIVTIRQVHDCYQVSQKLDGERNSHYTVLLGYFIRLSTILRQLAENVKDWLGEPVQQLTVHPNQEAAGVKILAELAFWEKFMNEDNDFTDLHKYKTIEEYRGLNTGEVSLYGAVVNLLPVMLNTIEGITLEVSKWLNITYRLGNGMFRDRKSLLVNDAVPNSARPGSHANSRPGSAVPRPASRPSSATPRPASRPSSATPRPVSRPSSATPRPASRPSSARPASRASAADNRPSSRSSQDRPATARERVPSRQGIITVATQTEFSRQPSREKPKTRVASAPPTRRSYTEQLAARYKGKISLYERPPWKPASKIPHNLYPQLHIHLD